ncbi:hypothetical protein ACRQ5D_09345 [Mucilaginibacter sp. P25]|uniref:Uncharacterized protein n=1 Tax=Mucilaginibacter gossypii TaxID=551996 RepID=A0A1G8HZP7_9SPHI|nr:hypothetical protein [Mucilaginibacter gossypii]SDI12032.1 hypothetical protein SAMN05192573_11675 [Mucilaginibacter gossypii]
MEKFLKTPDQISALMQHWFLSYHRKDRDSFSGSEAFTFFDLIPEGLQQALLQRANLDEHEKPVFLLNCGNAGFVLNTTHRFIRIGESDLDSIFYTEFTWHSGYKSIRIEGAPIGIKSDGYFAEFGLETQRREIVYWLIPSGKAGFAFWNVTKKCELIGRKYL